MIPYIKTTRNNNTIECNVDLAVLHNKTPILLSITDIAISVKKLVSDVIQPNSDISLHNRKDIMEKDELYTWGEKFKYKLTKHDNLRTHAMIHNTNLDNYIFDWGNEGLATVLTNHLREKYYLPVTEEIVEKVIGQVRVERLVQKCEVFTTQEEVENMDVWYLPHDKDFKMYLESVELDNQDKFDWDKVEDVRDYLTEFSEPVKNRLEDNINILYNESKINPKIDDKVTLFEGQKAIVQGGIETLKRRENRFLYLATGMGTGKTIMGSKINHLYNYTERGKKNYISLVVAPSITLTQWRDELQSVNDEELDVIIIKNTDELIRFYGNGRLKVNKPTYLLMGKETLKLSHQVKHGVNTRTQKITTGEGWNKTTETVEVCLCPDCGSPLKNPLRKETVYFTIKDFNKPKKSNYKCSECESVLFQSVYNKTKKMSAIDFIKARNIKFDSVIVDEVHESNNFESLVGAATREVLKVGKKAILLSGTVTNGYASSIYNILFALIPNTLKRDNVFSKEKFVKAYGTLEAVTTNKDSEFYASGRQKIRESAFREVEGINPLVFTRYMSNNFIFAELEDLRDDLPELKEHYVGIEHTDEMTKNEIRLVNEIVSASPFNASFYNDSVIKHYTNKPFEWRELVFQQKKGNTKYVQPTNVAQTVLPKEEKLVEICNDNKEQGKKTWVYCDFVTTGSYTSDESLQNRLKRTLEENGLSVFVLTSSTTALKRREVIQKAEKSGKYDVFISHPKLISVGINLQWCTNYVFYTPSYHVNTVRQAMRRGLRIDSDPNTDHNIYHLHYDSGIEDEIMKRYQLKRMEAEAIENKFVEVDGVNRTASSLGARIEKELTEAI